MGHLAPLDFIREFTVVLPQRYRTRVCAVVPIDAQAVVLLIQDFTRAPAGRTRGAQWNDLEPIWRLYRYDMPDPMAIEVCTFTQSVNETVHPVFVDQSGEHVVLLFHDQLLKVDLAERKADTICRLRLGSESPAIHGFAAHGNTVSLVVGHDSTDMAIHWIPLDNNPTIGVRFAGDHLDDMVFGPDGSLYLLGSLDVTRYRNGELISEMDVSSLFDDWHTHERSVFAVGSQGQVCVGSGSKLVVLSADLQRVISEGEMPVGVRTMAFVPDSDRLLVSSVDEQSGQLIIREVRG